MPPFITAIVPVWNGGRFIRPLLESLLDSNHPKNRLAVLICDNGSADDSLREIDDSFRRLRLQGVFCRVISPGKNLGVPRAYNLLLAGLPPQTDYVLRLDQDVLLEREALPGMLEAFESRRNAGIVGPIFVDYESGEKTVHGPGRLSAWRMKIGQGDPRIPGPCDWLHGAAMLIRADLFTRGGLRFSEDYFLYYDDTVICLEARALGRDVVYWPSAKVRHAVSTTRDKSSRRRMYYSVRGRLLLAARHGSWKQKLGCLVPFFFIGCHWNALRSAIAGHPDLAIIPYLAGFDYLTSRLGKRL